MTRPADLRRTVLVVALLNFAYFFVEFAVALHIGSLALFADSVDFFEDAAVNLLIVAAIAWSAPRRARVGRLLALIMLAPAVAFLWTLWGKLGAPIPPEPLSMSATGFGALAVNLLCAFLLARFRGGHGSLAVAAFLSARNDAFSNIAIIAAAAVTAAHPSIWPDIIVGFGIAWINLDAAREVWEAANAEHDEMPHS